MDTERGKENPTNQKGIKIMKKFNLWRSTLSGQVYEMELDWLPRFGGWELIGTICR